MGGKLKPKGNACHTSLLKYCLTLKGDSFNKFPEALGKWYLITVCLIVGPALDVILLNARLSWWRRHLLFALSDEEPLSSLARILGIGYLFQPYSYCLGFLLLEFFFLDLISNTLLVI